MLEADGETRDQRRAAARLSPHVRGEGCAFASERSATPAASTLTLNDVPVPPLGRDGQVLHDVVLDRAALQRARRRASARPSNERLVPPSFPAPCIIERIESGQYPREVVRDDRPRISAAAAGRSHRRAGVSDATRRTRRSPPPRGRRWPTFRRAAFTRSPRTRARRPSIWRCSCAPRDDPFILEALIRNRAVPDALVAELAARRRRRRAGSHRHQSGAHPPRAGDPRRAARESAI